MAPTTLAGTVPYARQKRVRLKKRWLPGLLIAGTLTIPAAAAETSLRMSSEAGDYIGIGQQYFYAAADGSFYSYSTPSHVDISFSTPSYSHWWYLDFAAPAGEILAVGDYPGATRYPFQSSSEPGLDVSGDGRGCNMLTGSFRIKQIAFGPGSELQSFWAVFEQHCEGQVPALTGDIRYNADVVVSVSAPLEEKVEKAQTLTFDVTASDVNGRHVTLTATGRPSGALFTDHGNNSGTFSWITGFDQAGTYTVSFQGDNGEGATDTINTTIHVTGITSLRMDSDAGDYIGAGQQYFFTPADGRFTLSQNYDQGASASFYSEDHFWYLDFAAPHSAPLSVGAYEGATRFPFQDPSQPGLSVDGDGRGCNTLLGRFDVKQVTYNASGGVDALWASFEQHCEGASPALRGEVRYNADVPLLLRVPSSVSGPAGQPLAFDAKAYDINAAHLTLTATGVPPGATFTDHGDNTGTFRWVPAADQVGEYVITLLADDGHGMTDKATTRVLAVVANDSFDHATVIPAMPFTETLPSLVATREDDDPPCVFGNTVWYAYTPTQDVDIDANNSGSDFSAYLGVFTGSRGALTEVVCAYTAVSFHATAGRTYYFVLGSYYGGRLVFSARIPPPPPINDDFNQATRIGSLPYDDMIDVDLATRAPDDPSCGGGVTVWYAYTAQESTEIDLDTSGSDSVNTTGVYTGARGALTQIACSYAPFSFPAEAGKTYYFLVNAYGGRVHFSVRKPPPPPANDDFDQATSILALPFNDTVNLGRATMAPDDPSCTAGGTVWYAYAPSEDTRIVATGTSDYGTLLSVLTGSRGALTQVGCEYGGIAFTARKGVMYFIMVSAYGSGNVSLSVSGFPPLQIGVTIDPDGTFESKTGSATISGRVTCSRPLTMDLTGRVQQRVGRLFIDGVFQMQATCDESGSWTASVSSANGIFSGGKVAVSVDASGVDYATAEQAEANASVVVSLKGSGGGHK